jgi:hypothetical protein
MTDWEKFVWHLKLHYNLTPEEVMPTKAPGYWQIKKKCGGVGECRNPIHGFMFCTEPMHHTISYRDEPRDRKTGRWASPYRTWKEAVRLWMVEQASPDKFIKDELRKSTVDMMNQSKRESAKRRGIG